MLLFRLMSFWLPVLPGWVAFNYLTRKERSKSCRRRRPHGASYGTAPCRNAAHALVRGAPPPREAPHRRRALATGTTGSHAEPRARRRPGAIPTRTGARRTRRPGRAIRGGDPTVTRPRGLAGGAQDGGMPRTCGCRCRTAAVLAAVLAGGCSDSDKEGKPKAGGTSAPRRSSGGSARPPRPRPGRRAPAPLPGLAVRHHVRARSTTRNPTADTIELALIRAKAARQGQAASAPSSSTSAAPAAPGVTTLPAVAQGLRDAARPLRPGELRPARGRPQRRWSARATGSSTRTTRRTPPPTTAAEEKALVTASEVLARLREELRDGSSRTSAPRTPPATWT